MFYTHVAPYYGQLIVRGYLNGKRFNEKVKFKPYMFVENHTDKKAQYRDYTNTKRLSKIEFDSIKEAKEFIQNYRDVENFKIYGNHKFYYDWISDNYPEDVPYDMDVMSIVSLDIEVASDEGFPEPEYATKEITAITLSKRGKYYTFGCGDYTPKNNNVKYCKCRDEKDLLYKFLDFWKILDPDIITGWNVEFFDIPYIHNRMKNLLSEDDANSMSHWGFVMDKEVNQKYGKGKIKSISGSTILDYMTLYKKFSFTPQENYRLNTVATYELDLGKIDYSGSLLDLYKTDYEKFIDYNIRDVELVNMMDDKLKFIELTCAIAYDAKVNLADALTTVTLWDVIIQNYLKKKNIVVPYQDPEGVSEENYYIEGGYVKDPEVGYHEWVVSWDFDSLYPHIAMMLNISPDTLDVVQMSPSVTEVLEKGFSQDIKDSIEVNNSAIALNGATFSRDKVGFFADLMKIIYKDRQHYKSIMSQAKKEFQQTPTPENKKKIAKYNAFQHAKKIQLNAAYGALGNKYFRWHNHILAEAITKTGQFCIRYIEKRMNKYLNEKNNTNIDYVVASDTDSVYVKFDKEENINEDEINKKIAEWCEEIYITLNAFDKSLKMKRENISSSGIWTSKKHYVLNVIDSEGTRFKEPKLKMMGIEAVKSSTPTVVKNKMVDAIKIILSGSQEKLFDFVDSTKKEFYASPYEDIASPRSISGLTKYHDPHTIWKKATPIQVKGSLVFNDYVKKKKLNLPLISDGDKVKFCYLKLPNPLRSEVIAVHNEMPKELKIDSYIDRATQFEKAFLKPLLSIASQRGWDVEERSTLF
jgi:DNA polymerase elongation subunit (family B)